MEAVQRNALLSITYFGPVQWYQKLYRSDHVWVEACETFQKQTYRNRCIIATTSGPLTLSFPVEHTPAATIRDVRISSHGKWRTEHWNALKSAYGESPFFDYYEDDLRPFFEKPWDYLFDFNMAIMHKMCELLDIHPQVSLTDNYLPAACQKTVQGSDEQSAKEVDSPLCEGRSMLSGDITDYRDVIRPKKPLADVSFEPRPYYQVYQSKHGFLPNLSILDLLFNMGNESIFYL